MIFGKQLLERVGKASKAVSNSKLRYKFGEQITQGKYTSRIGAMNEGKVRQKIWGKPFTQTSEKNRKIAVAASNAKIARKRARVEKGLTAKQDFFPRVSNMGPGTKRVIGAGALVGIGAAGFANGIDDKNQVSNSVYDLAFGNSDYDKYVLGRKMGVRSLLAPMPGEMRMKGAMGLGTLIGQPSGSLLTGQTYSDAWRASRKSQPRVDGSIAFGMYNARLG